jgi:hypothetical protein
MNDAELDEMLDQWKAPAPRFRLRRPKRRLPRWIPVSLAAAAVFFVVVRAFPQAAPGSIPYVVESEYFHYERGNRVVTMHTYSYNLQGGEQMVSRWVPGDSAGNATRQMLDVPVRIFSSFVIPRLTAPGETPGAAWIRPVGSSGVIASCSRACLVTQSWGMGSGAALIANGCVWPGSTVIERETILGHATVASSFTPRFGRRFTTWMAPDLGCFALKLTEEYRIDDAFRVIGAKQALQILH